MRPSGGTRVTFGDYGIQALEPAYVTNRQIESARIAINRHIRRGGKVWIRIFPHKPVTAKPAETRMGSGKGAPDHWVAVVKPVWILFELSGVREEVAKEALRRAGHKLPVETRFVVRQRGEAQVVTISSDESMETSEELAEKRDASAAASAESAAAVEGSEE